MKKIIIISLIIIAFIFPRAVNVVNTGANAVFTKKFCVEVMKGNVDGYSAIQKFGVNNDIDTASTPESIWDYGGEYVFSTTNNINQISSSSNQDTQVIEVQGLDLNYNLVLQNVTLRGTTNVYLATNLLRVFRMKNLGSTDNAGRIYLSVTNTSNTAGVPGVASNVRAMIDYGMNQTLMSIYTIPSGCTGFMDKIALSFANSRTTGATLQLRARQENGVFQIKKVFALQGAGTSAIVLPYCLPLKFTEKTDILIKCTDVGANDTAISAAFDIMLIENQYLTQ